MLNSTKRSERRIANDLKTNIILWVQDGRDSKIIRNGSRMEVGPTYKSGSKIGGWVQDRSIQKWVHDNDEPNMTFSNISVRESRKYARSLFLLGMLNSTKRSARRIAKISKQILRLWGQDGRDIKIKGNSCRVEVGPRKVSARSRYAKVGP